MRVNECKCVMRTKLRAFLNHSPSQQQVCTRNALAFIIFVPKFEEKKNDNSDMERSEIG